MLADDTNRIINCRSDLSMASIIDIFGPIRQFGQDAHNIAWPRNNQSLRESRLRGTFSQDNDERWANAWLELILIASQFLKEKDANKSGSN